MPAPLLLTKLYLPPSRPDLVARPRLVERLNEGLHRHLTLISAPAGFGKTTLVSEWLAGCQRSDPAVRAAWLSLDEGDSELARFLTYLVAALQTLSTEAGVGKMGAGVLAALQSPQPPPLESMLITLVNDITTIPAPFVLVLDDYQVIDSGAVDAALAFLVEHQPPQMHLVITTREVPALPLARLRARGQLVELRAADLRFTPTEAAAFLYQRLGLTLADADIAALEARTEGWIAGLQLAAISIQGHPDATSFIQSFTGSNHFVLDYLLEEVLHQQPERIQTFLLQTAILDRLCGPLCDAVLTDPASGSQETGGQATVEFLERANLFIVPLDNERRWYRYHHLFRDLLRQRLGERGNTVAVAELHIRASQWFEDNGLEREAFSHAIAANDVERAARLIEGRGMQGQPGVPLYFRGVLTPVRSWLESLPAAVLDSRPVLWTTFASVCLATGQAAVVEEKLQAAEIALAALLQGAEPDDSERDLIGRIASIRATMAVYQNQPEVIIRQSRHALSFLHPDNLAFRTFTTWKLAVAYQQQGNRAAAAQAYSEALSVAQASGNIITAVVALTGLGAIHETENELHQAVEIYQQVMQLARDLPLLVPIYQANLGLGRIYLEWNDLDTAEQFAQKGAAFVANLGKPDESITCAVLLARVRLARGDVTGAERLLDQAEQAARQGSFLRHLPAIAAARAPVLLRQNHLEAAAALAEEYDLPMVQARVLLCQRKPSEALALLAPLYQQAKDRGWQDQRLKQMVLLTIAYHAHGETGRAAQLLGEALALAEPGGCIRTFVDEGEPMRLLLEDQARHSGSHLRGYAGKLLDAFAQPAVAPKSAAGYLATGLVEPLSSREREVLQLLRGDLSGPEIARELIVSINTLRSHTKNIFSKLGVNDRRAAVRRAEELDLF